MLIRIVIFGIVFRNSIQGRRIGGFGRRNKRGRSDLDPGGKIREGRLCHGREGCGFSNSGNERKNV